MKGSQLKLFYKIMLIFLNRIKKKIKKYNLFYISYFWEHSYGKLL